MSVFVFFLRLEMGMFYGKTVSNQHKIRFVLMDDSISYPPSQL